MKSATFKNPYTLAAPEKIEPNLRQTIFAWLKARETMAKEKRVPDSERITVTNLPVYASNNFSTQKGDCTFFLVGDAAFGVPYFRALNNGILCSAQLAKVIDAMLRKQNIQRVSFSKSFMQEEYPQDYYVHYVQELVKREAFIARMKTTGVSSLETAAAVSRAMPYLKQASLLTSPQGRNFKASMEEATPQGNAGKKCVIL